MPHGESSDTDEDIGDPLSLHHGDADEWARSLLNAGGPAPRARHRGQLVAGLEGVCRAAAEQLGLSGASISLDVPGGAHAVVAVSDAVARRWAELEFDLGEGPAIEAFRLGKPVLAGNLVGGESAEWPGFAAGALAAGLGSVFALPLQVGVTRLGVLTLFATRTTRLGEQARARAFAVADLVTNILLDANNLGEHGAPDTLQFELEGGLGLRSEVYQAQGALMTSLGIGLPEALARLRAHAFATGRSLNSVAVDVVERRLELDPDRPDGPTGPHTSEDVQP